MTVVDFVSEHLDPSKLVGNFQLFAENRLNSLARHYIFVVADSPVYLAAYRTLASFKSSSHPDAPNLRESLILVPGALHTARSAGKLLLRGWCRGGLAGYGFAGLGSPVGLPRRHRQSSQALAAHALHEPKRVQLEGISVCWACRDLVCLSLRLTLSFPPLPDALDAC